MQCMGDVRKLMGMLVTETPMPQPEECLIPQSVPSATPGTVTAAPSVDEQAPPPPPQVRICMIFMATYRKLHHMVFFSIILFQIIIVCYQICIYIEKVPMVSFSIILIEVITCGITFGVLLLGK